MLGNVDLVNLAGRQLLAEIGNGAYHTEIIGADGASKGVADKEIADKHGDMVVPRIVDGVVAATLLGLVDHIVVYQRGVVEQFHRNLALSTTIIGRICLPFVSKYLSTISLSSGLLLESDCFIIFCSRSKSDDISSLISSKFVIKRFLRHKSNHLFCENCNFTVN